MNSRWDQELKCLEAAVLDLEAPVRDKVVTEVSKLLEAIHGDLEPFGERKPVARPAVQRLRTVVNRLSRTLDQQSANRGQSS